MSIWKWLWDTETKYYDEEINRDTDWGGDESTGNVPVSGGRVQEWLKNEINARVGYVVRSTEKEEDGLFHVRGFSTEEDYNNWLSDKDTYAECVLIHFTIPDMSSTTASYVLNLVSGAANYIVSTDGSVVLPLRFVSVLYSPIDQSTTDSGEAGTLTIQTRSSSTASWVTRGTMPMQSLSKDSTDYTMVDISGYLSNGEQQVRCIVKGETSDASTNYVTLTVVKTALTLSFANDWWNPIRSAAITPAYYINGAVEKTLNLVIDGKRTVTSYIGTTTYTDTPFGNVTVTDSASESNPVCTQGIHTIEAWLSVDKNGVHVESDHVTSRVLIILDDTQTERYVILNDLATEAVNWTEATLFTYAVYSSDGGTLPLEFVMTDYNGTETYATYPMGDVAEGVKNIFATMLEIESSYTEFSVRLQIRSGDELLETLTLSIDNSQNFAPTEGADFILNPKLRSNQESNPATVVNAVTGETVAAEFNGFGFVNDGYVTDDNGNKCLRVLAGDSLHITGYEAFSGFMGDSHTASLTMEFDFAVRNVTNEDEPILRMCSYNNGIPVGWEMKPLDAMFGTLGLQVRLDQDIAWSEGVRTHVVVNIVHNLANSGLNYIRIFVNGIINREMSYLATDTFVQYDASGVKTSGGIHIGAGQAEIDIYGIRILKKALSSSNVMQDRSAALPTSEEKRAFREANDIMYNGVINYEMARLKYNTLLWKYNSRQPSTRLATYGDVKKQLQYGDLVVNIVGDSKRSGTMFGVNTQGQGTSSMSYWKWNQRFQFDDGGYFVNELGETFPAERWQLMEGMPYSYRNDAKLNWASSMQSHKLGATALFHDCWKKIINRNTLLDTEGGQDFTNTDGGYADCRVAVRQLPFMMFVQKDESSEPEFYGLYTMGPGKGDKPTFGYDKDTFPDYTMLEGCDNNKALVMHRVPWDNNVTGSQADEKWSYNGEESWEISIGSGNLWGEFKDAFNFVYMHHTDIHPYIGTLADLKADADADQNKDYWVTYADSNAAKYDLFRYDIVDKAWVPCGMNKTTLNLATQCAASYTPGGTDYDAINAGFIAARIAMFKASADTHFDIQDFIYCMMFLRIVAATDNRGKNTYLYKIKAGDPIRCFQDDLDSIKPTDNVGRKTKPYHIEEHDTNADGQPYWNSSRNALYNMIEQAYPDECKAMVASILTAMAELGGGTLEGCYQKYFYDVQEYFPAVAYNEIARLLYEDAAKALADGRYTTNTPPLPQCLGDQLQSEKEWDRKRLVYMSSYANYGEFASGEVSGALAFRSILTTTGASPRYSFTVVPHLWLYPANGTGDSVFPSGVRVKAGESFTFPERTSDGNTNVRIHGINYYRKIGEFGDKSVGEAFALSGERLTEFVAASDAPEFRITSMTVSARNLEKIDLTGISTLKGSLDLTRQQRLKEILLSATSLTSVVLPETDALVSLCLPATLTSLRIGNQPNLSSVVIDSTDSLQTVYIDHSKARSFDSKALVQALYTTYVTTGSVPASVTLLEVEWSDLPVAVLDWLVFKVPNLTLTGTISVAESSTSGSSVNFALKQRIVQRFGNVDDVSNDLYLEYNPRAISSITIAGDTYIRTAGQYQFTVKPNTNYGNDFVSIQWSLTSNAYATVDADTGVLTATSVGEEMYKPEATLTCTMTKTDGSTLTATRVLGLYDRAAQVGDYVYADGSYSDILDNNKTPIGVCYYINPDDPTDRRMVALANIGSYPWGLMPRLSSETDEWNENYSIGGIELVDNPSYSVYDINSITNIGWQTLNDGTSYIKDANYRDETDTGDADGFYIYANTHPAGDMGLVTLTTDFHGYPAGTKLPIGLVKTLRIIDHRDTILNDSGVNLPIPAASATQTKMENLISLMDEVVTNYGASKYRQYYYPAASLCNAYEPTVTRDGEVLSDKFKAGNWYLPSSGELARMYWYKSKGYEVGDEFAIFAAAATAGVLTKFSSSYHWSCSESHSINSWFVYFESGNLYTGYGKNYSYVVRAVSAF